MLLHIQLVILLCKEVLIITVQLLIQTKHLQTHRIGMHYLQTIHMKYHPYLEAELFDVHYVQSADVMTLVHPNHAPKELRRLGATKWELKV